MQGVPITVIATGMGQPMLDFVTREARRVVEGPMAMLRYGTCGVIDSSCTAGDVIV
jgi:uridine phosphorylase